MSDDKYMIEALTEAEKAKKRGEVPVGAIIVEDDKIIGRGHNLKETAKVVTKHAELIAIEEASLSKQNWRLNECIMYVTEEPCPMCASAIKQSRIKRVIYKNDAQNENNKQLVDKIWATIDHNPVVECIKITDKKIEKNSLQDFFVDKRKN